jgi:predicted esterase
MRVLSIISVLILALAWTGCPVERPTTGTFSVMRNIPYAQGYVADIGKVDGFALRDLVLDVYIPDDTASPVPAIILMHGGGFVEGSKDDERIVEFSEFFAARGYAAFAINYRLVDADPPSPAYWESTALSSAIHAAIVDAKAAIRFVRASAGTYNVDPNRIAFLGESAGAIAGVTAAVTESNAFSNDGTDFPIPDFNNPSESSRLQAYVHFWGSADHVLLNIRGDDPPTMIVHGTDDDTPLAAFGASERLHAALEFWGIPHEFYQAEGFGHGAWNYSQRGLGLKSLTLEFLNEHL